MHREKCDTQTHSHTYIHTHTMEYYSAIKKNEILLFATTRRDLVGILLNEISQQEKYHMISLISGIIDTENKLVVARGRGYGVGKMGEGGQKVPTSS